MAFTTLLLITLTYTFAIVEFFNCELGGTGPANKLFALTTTVTDKISKVLPVVYIYQMKLNDMGYPCRANMVSNIYSFTALFVMIYILLVYLNIDKFEKEYEEKILLTKSFGQEKVKRLRFAMVFMFSGAVLVGYYFFFGDPSMEIPGRLNDNIHINKWNLLRAPIFGGVFFMFLTRAMVIRKYISAHGL